MRFNRLNYDTGVPVNPFRWRDLIAPIAVIAAFAYLVSAIGAIGTHPRCPAGSELRNKVNASQVVPGPAHCYALHGGKWRWVAP